MLFSWFLPLQRGIMMMKAQKYHEAIQYFNQCIAKKQHRAQSYFNLGRCYFKIGQYEDTKTNLHHALDHDSSPKMIREIIEMTNWRMLVSHEYFNQCLSFSADGCTLAYTSARRDTNGDGIINALDYNGVYLYNLATGQETSIVPASAPQGRYGRNATHRWGTTAHLITGPGSQHPDTDNRTGTTTRTTTCTITVLLALFTMPEMHCYFSEISFIYLITVILLFNICLL